jgi:3-mercaptopyruvate sulfurtransferase SseA
LAALSEENHENIRALEGGRVHWHIKKAYIGNSEENHENVRALEGGYVHWHVKKAYTGNSF